MNYKQKVHSLVQQFINTYCLGNYTIEPNTLYSLDKLIERTELHTIQLLRLFGIKWYSRDDTSELSVYYFFDSNMNKVIDHSDVEENNTENCPHCSHQSDADNECNAKWCDVCGHHYPG